MGLAALGAHLILAGAAEAQRSPLNSFPPGDSAIAFRNLRAGGLRLPSTGVARITTASEWRELWHRFNRWASANAEAVPPVDFSRDMVVVISSRGPYLTATDTAAVRITARRDTMAIWPMPAGGPSCFNSTALTRAIAVAKNTMAIVVAGVPQQADAWRTWRERRTLTEVQGVADQAARMAWIEQIAVDDSSPSATARLVERAKDLNAQSMLLMLPWVQRDTAVVRRLYMAGAQWSDEATRILVATRGRQITADPHASPTDLAFIAGFMIKCRDGGPLLASIYNHPAIATDFALRTQIRDSRLLPP